MEPTWGVPPRRKFGTQATTTVTRSLTIATAEFSETQNVQIQIETIAENFIARISAFLWKSDNPIDPGVEAA